MFNESEECENHLIINRQIPAEFSHLFAPNFNKDLFDEILLKTGSVNQAWEAVRVVTAFARKISVPRPVTKRGISA